MYSNVVTAIDKILRSYYVSTGSAVLREVTLKPTELEEICLLRHMAELQPRKNKKKGKAQAYHSTTGGKTLYAMIGPSGV